MLNFCDFIQVFVLTTNHHLKIMYTHMIAHKVIKLCRPTGEGWSTANYLKPPSNFIAGRPKVALLFWFFGGFRCGVPLFIVIPDIC